MSLDLLNLSRIASATITLSPIANTIIAMATTQSNPSPVELADRAHRNLFVIQLIFLLLAALVAAILTWLVWRAGNRYQDAVKADADVRIAEAKQGASEADAKAAEANLGAAKANEGLAKSNEEIARLTAEAEAAKTERAEADKQIAIAKANAARADEGAAKATIEVARLQIVVASAETKRAEAQRALLELQERLKPRRLIPEQRTRLVGVLRAGQKGKVEIECVMGSQEACDFADDISSALREAGWDASLAARGSLSGVPPGINIMQHNEGRAIPPLRTLLDAFSAIGVQVNPAANTAAPEGGVLIRVGVKP